MTAANKKKETLLKKASVYINLLHIFCKEMCCLNITATVSNANFHTLFYLY